MTTSRIHGEYTWIDLHSPSKQEVESLVETKHVDPIIAKDLLSPTPKQYLKLSGDKIYTVIHIPSFNNKESFSHEQEIDFVISENYVVTTRYESIDALHYFGKKIETEEIISKEKDDKNHIFFLMMKDIYKFLFDQIDYIGDTIKNVEQNIFKGKEKEMVISISIIARNMLNFKRVIYPHRILWLNLIENGKEMFGKNFEKDAKNIFDELERLILEIEHISKMVDELRDTNNSILSTRQNETMKTFTILAFLTLPLSLVASLFGMNSENMPIMGMKYDFWIILGMMFCIGIALFMYFKYKKWI